MGNSDSKSLTDGVGGEAGNLSSTSPIAANKQQKYDDSNNNNYDTTEEDQSSSEKRESADRRTQKRSSASNQRDTTQPSSSSSKQNINKKITDDQIHVNMAMADLMAYLQVVANNSNHLPLTRRDDPELDRTVSTLSSEDYARKSAAFVPANVRILGGTFTRYGRVWDLPTSEEFNACDGAHEPGRSYGGAFCNTMLKVVYDAANEMEGAAQTEAAAQSLFQDDDDEDDDEPSITGKSFKSGYSLEFGGNLQHGRITWANMLRQLKSEFKDVGYAQSPKITTTRKFDLNTPFSLADDNFDPQTNQKRSLLIGCNYRNITGAELKASHDDVRSIKDYIVNVHGFSEHSDLMTILLDDDVSTPPTFSNIIEAFKTLSEEAQPGDAVFVQFSGHGGRVLDVSNNDTDSESYDETICPVDYEQQGLIRDTLIFKTLLAPMRYGVTLTIMIDCCDTGMLLDLPYAWNAKTDKKGSVAKLSMNEDFSFVRFLKVVKTLYESSTFTQLGKTVGSALNPLSGPIYSNKLDDESKKGGRASNRNKDSKKPISPGSDSIFDAFTDACSAVQKDTVGRDESMRSKEDQKTVSRKDNLFEQMIKGCNLLSSPAEDEFSDEDTFKTRTEDDHSYFSEGESFETMTDDGYESRRRSKRRN